MEESEKRRERLKVMRMEAAEAIDSNTEAHNSMVESIGHGLRNPLIESPSASIGQAEPRPRFDFYTDPMAAFSANKKKNNVSPQFSQPFNMPPPPRPMYTAPPAYHTQVNDTPAQSPHWPLGVNASLGIRGQTGHYDTPPGNSSNTWDSSFGLPNNHFRPNSPQLANFSGHGFPRGGGASSQYGQGSPYQGSGFRGRPHQDSGFRGSPHQGSGFRVSPHQGSGFRGSPHQGSGFRGSPHQGSGFRGSPHQGSGFRGSPHHGSVFRGSPHHGSGRGRGVKSYYDRSMVEDPWNQLKPIIWKPIIDTRKSWLPNSISTKKAKVEEAPTKSTPQQSLAEYLAAAFDEAAGKEAANDESGT